ncbi:hypothetical protein [Streptomyces sediminimaris]|uniref:hypothetical protein n=1 Tax=Streptomyces sediminimaris TaxID=3383721 RepID=UPI003999F85D
MGLPLLFIEADNCTEEVPIIAAKFDKYMRHFHRKVKDIDGQDKPMWRTRWSAPDPRWGDATHPPVLLVFHQVGKRTVLTQMKNVADLTREHWQGQWAEGGFRVYNQKMPIVATTLELLRERPGRARVLAFRPRGPTEPVGGDRQPPPGRSPRSPC